jgi:alkylhydroperoxidase/carboxymuconolactone decarboxylase family protein YurZ
VDKMMVTWGVVSLIVSWLAQTKCRTFYEGSSHISRITSMPYDDAVVVGYLRRAHDTALLSEREKHLVGLAVTITRGCQVCTRNRIEKARAAGIGDDALNALVNVVSAVNAGVSAATAREGFRMADADADPQACGDVCSAEVAGRVESRHS